MKNRFIILVSLIVFSSLSCSSETNKESLSKSSKITKAAIQETPTTIKEVIVPPTLSLIESPALNENNLIPLGFRSSKPGNISYGGGCFSSTRNAIKGEHHILLGTMVEGNYDDCTIQVTDTEGNTSDPLQVPQHSHFWIASLARSALKAQFTTSGNNQETKVRSPTV